MAEYQLQRMVDDAIVRQLEDPLTGQPLHCALYGAERNTKLDIVQFLPMFATVTHADRVAQGAVLAQSCNARVLQITHQGFRGSGISLRQISGAARGDFTHHAASIQATIEKYGPDNFSLARSLLVGESIGGVVAAHTATITRVGALALIDAGSMEKQVSTYIMRGMFQEFRKFNSQRKASVSISTDGMVVPVGFTPKHRGVIGRLPFNPVLLPLILTPGSNSNATIRCLNVALEADEVLRVSGRIAEHSQLFPSHGAAKQFEALQQAYGSERVAYEVVPNRSHYTITADTQEFAAMVCQQIVEVGLANRLV